MSKRYAIYGLGGFGREVLPLLQNMGDVVFVDDEGGQGHGNVRVLDFEQLIGAEHRDRATVVAIGNGRTREIVEQKCRKSDLQLDSVIAPTARLIGPSEIGEGSILCDFVTVTSDVKIGRSFHANIYSYVAHDCVVGNYVTFAPRVSCNGNVIIEDHAYLGTGASIIQGKSGKPVVIGEGAVVGMGAVVTKSVDPYTVVVGNPARPLRKLSGPR